MLWTLLSQQVRLFGLSGAFHPTYITPDDVIESNPPAYEDLMILDEAAGELFLSFCFVLSY